MENTNESEIAKKANELEKKFAKKSNEINYSPKIFENQPQINFYKVQEEKEYGNIENIGVFILKYKINGIQQEAIIGKLKNEYRAFEKAKEIKELIEKQLKENVNENNELKSFNELKKFVLLNKLPFEFTMEGSDIITYTGKEDIQVRRTYYEETNGDKNSRIQCLYSQEKMREFARERKQNNREILKQIEANKKWNKRRSLILNLLSNDEERKKFLKGEKISEIVELTDEKTILENYRTEIIEYISENYELYGNSENEIEKVTSTNSFADFLSLKEKGIAIDIKKILEDIQRKFEEDLLENSKKGFTEKEEINNRRSLNTLENYSRFFDLIKAGKELNARLVATSIYNINFDIMKKLIERATNDKELVQYIELKGKSIKDIQTQDQNKNQINEKSDAIQYQRDMKYEYYKENESVRELYKFLSKASTRKYTKKEEDKKLLDTFDSIKVDLIKNNIEAVQKYNYYAEKSEIYVCPVPEKNELINEKDKKEEPVLKKLVNISEKELENAMSGNEPEEQGR